MSLSQNFNSILKSDKIIIIIRGESITAMSLAVWTDLECNIFIYGLNKKIASKLWAAILKSSFWVSKNAQRLLKELKRRTFAFSLDLEKHLQFQTQQFFPWPETSYIHITSYICQWRGVQFKNTFNRIFCCPIQCLGFTFGKTGKLMYVEEMTKYSVTHRTKNWQ